MTQFKHDCLQNKKRKKKFKRQQLKIATKRVIKVHFSFSRTKQLQNHPRITLQEINQQQQVFLFRWKIRRRAPRPRFTPYSAFYRCVSLICAAINGSIISYKHRNIRRSLKRKSIHITLESFLSEYLWEGTRRNKSKIAGRREMKEEEEEIHLFPPQHTDKHRRMSNFTSFISFVSNRLKFNVNFYLSSLIHSRSTHLSSSSEFSETFLFSLHFYH